VVDQRDRRAGLALGTVRDAAVPGVVYHALELVMDACRRGIERLDVACSYWLTRDDRESDQPASVHRDLQFALTTHCGVGRL